MKTLLKRHAVSKETARKIAASPPFANMLKEMLFHAATTFCFEFVDKKPGRKAIITVTGPADFELDFLEPDGTKCENPFAEVNL